MGHSRNDYFLHLVWATYRREPYLDGDLEALIYACIRSEARQLGCKVLALGGLADHVHLVVQPPTTVAPARIAQQTKGVSSRFAEAKGIAFKWQAGFDVLSLSRQHVREAIPYVQNQKHHHADNDLWPEWKPTDD